MKDSLFQNSEARETIRQECERFRARLTVPVEDVTLATSFGSTHVLVTGPVEGPPLVILHGALASSAHVLPELGPMLKTRRVYAVDVMGQSVWSEDRRIDVRDGSYARWLEEVCDGLGLTTFDLYGISWGGFVALQGAIRMPARVRHLVLLAPAGVVANKPWPAFRDAGWPMLAYIKFPSPKRLDRAMRSLFTTLDPDWTSYMGKALLAYRLDMRIPPLAQPEATRAITCPTQVFGADEDASFPGEALLKRVKELVPHAETELLANCKHCPPLTPEFRKRMAARIEPFLRL
jgi:pimeloyl-ACP methyl ester carboxylesterase